jgi:hypothetical protein
VLPFSCLGVLAFISTADPGSSVISFGGTKKKEHFNSKSMQALASSDSSLSVKLKIKSNSVADSGSGVISFVGTTSKAYFSADLGSSVWWN